MKVLVIGHPDAVLGFSLAGVGGRVASTADEVNLALDDVASRFRWWWRFPRAAAFQRDRHRLAILSCARSVSSYNPFLTQENELEVYL